MTMADMESAANEHGRLVTSRQDKDQISPLVLPGGKLSCQHLTVKAPRVPDYTTDRIMAKFVATGY